MRRRPLAALAVLVLAALAAGSAERGWRRWRSTRVVPDGGACWIWAPATIPAKLSQAPKPVAFYALGFVDLVDRPLSARLEIVADEGYHVYLNGTWVGANTYREGAPADAYEVGDHLVAGTNRIAVELRSRRGVGGLVAALYLDDAPRPALVTNGAWRIHWTYSPALLDAGLVLGAGEDPVVWGEPPSGRWPLAPTSVTRPVLYGPGEAARIRRPVAGRPGARGPWTPIHAGRPRLPSRVTGRRLVFDWGRPVLGYPFLDLRDADVGPAVLSVAESLAELDRAPVELVAPVAGSPHWHASRPYRFRYLALVGVDLRRPPSAVILAPALAARLMPPELVLAGPFGLRPPVSATRAEEAVLAEIAARGY